MRRPDTHPRPAEPIGERLRILALFSLPPVGMPRSLRRERQMLRALVRRLVGAAGLGVELHVLQYGVTRANLQEVLEQGEAGTLSTSRAMAGRVNCYSNALTASRTWFPHLILAKLLRQAGGRVKLVTLSEPICGSEHRADHVLALGLSEGDEVQRDASEEAGKAAPTLARALTEALDCAASAMRYAVEDEFAANLARESDHKLSRPEQPLPRAWRLALASITGGEDGAAS